MRPAWIRISVDPMPRPAPVNTHAALRMRRVSACIDCHSGRRVRIAFPFDWAFLFDWSDATYVPTATKKTVTAITALA
jgi:hypothetical protein